MESRPSLICYGQTSDLSMLFEGFTAISIILGNFQIHCIPLLFKTKPVLLDLSGLFLLYDLNVCLFYMFQVNWLIFFLTRK